MQSWTFVYDSGEKTGAILEEQVSKPLSQIGLVLNEFNIANFDVEGSQLQLTSEESFPILKAFDGILINFHGSL